MKLLTFLFLLLPFMGTGQITYDTLYEREQFFIGASAYLQQRNNVKKYDTYLSKIVYGALSLDVRYMKDIKRFSLEAWGAVQINNEFNGYGSIGAIYYVERDLNFYTGPKIAVLYPIDIFLGWRVDVGHKKSMRLIVDVGYEVWNNLTVSYGLQIPLTLKDKRYYVKPQQEDTLF